MEWLQVFTIIASTLGGVYVFFMITAERINRLEQFHREDMKSMESRFAAMDAKWERLFERLLVQDKRHG
jgi:hypothetical protein